MKDESFTPSEGFETIATVIRDAKARFEEDGIIYVGWGLLIACAAFVQYYLIHNGHEKINYYPYFLMPIGAIASGLYSVKKERTGSKSHLSSIIGVIWVSISITVMVLGFLLAEQLRASLMPLIMIMISLGMMISGATIKNRVLLLAGILMNLIGFYSFTWEISEQPLIMGIASLLCVFLPGIILMRNHIENNV